MSKHYEQRKEANKRYLDKQDDIKIRLPKGSKAIVSAHAVSKGTSVNALISSLLLAELNMDAWPISADSPDKEE